MAEKFVVHCGDMRVVLDGMEPSSLDSCVTDPPYELKFMRYKWDGTGVSFQPKTWRAVYRVLKPGAHMLIFGGSRTYHRIAVAIEDAGFELRDTLCWMQSQGIPKSMDAGLAIDRAAGALRHDRFVGRPANNDVFEPTVEVLNAGTPVHDLAKKYDGFGTALKPAFEPIILARKPVVGTVAQNIARFGTGALNIDANRIEARPDLDFHPESGKKITNFNEDGRFPSNVVLSCECDGDEHVDDCPISMFGDKARFFFHTKASLAEKNFGLEGWDGPSNVYSRKRINNHPTVKPVALMEWLVNLVTPPGGTVLDPFAGSGSTGIAAVANGFGFIGCEQIPDFCELAKTRIENAVNNVIFREE